jgi:hypothetical protein
MHYKYHLFMRGAKHFNPYEKYVINTDHHSDVALVSDHHHSHHHSGGALISDDELLNMLSLHDHKKSHNRRKTGGSVKTRPYKRLIFTR